jgi:transcriptional regulator with GAF, ATPase, and Fis domain
VNDHRGVFEEADGGMIFLDEVGELSLSAQAMLLRVLSEGEIVPVGATLPRRVDVRVIAATSRDLATMVEEGDFRSDLYFRLRCLQIRVPPVRDRGEDWDLIASHFLCELSQRTSLRKELSLTAREELLGYPWPGNVREIRSVVETGFHLSVNEVIEPADFAESLEKLARTMQIHRVPVLPAAEDRLTRMTKGGEDFWRVVHRPFLDRQMGREEVRALIGRGLDMTRGSYKRLLPLFNIRAEDYLRFMDFLRHQRLKPESAP